VLGKRAEVSPRPRRRRSVASVDRRERLTNGARASGRTEETRVENGAGFALGRYSQILPTSSATRRAAISA
jgi:hypothetical protein